MRIGFGLPHVGPVASEENIRRLAVEAERLGYDSLWTLDRLLKPVEQKSPYPLAGDGALAPQYETVFEHMTVLTYVAAITERVRLGVGVLNLPYYHPVLLAKRIATLDRLSRGRLDVGIGVGWSEDEFGALGVPFRRRGPRTDEYVRALTALWAEDPVEFRGDSVEVPASVFGPKPLQRPHPPIYVGAFTSSALGRGGRVGDGFIGCCSSVSSILGRWRRFSQAAREANRGDMPAIVRCNVHLTDRVVSDPDRVVGVGTWEQVREDAQMLCEAGVSETFFDISFEPTNVDGAAMLRLLERLRGILDE